MKKQALTLLAGILIGALLFGGCLAIAATISATTADFPIYVDGKLADVDAISVDGVNYLKIKDVAQAVDVCVWWDNAEKAAKFETDKKYDPNYTGPAAEVTPTPTPTPTTKPVPTPKPTFTSSFTMVKRNEIVTIDVQGLPNTEYNLSVRYASGHVSEADGLGKAVSDSDGLVSWTWKVGGRTGFGKAVFTVSGGGESSTYEFEVVES